MGEKLKRLELLKDLVQQAVERGATSVQQVHEYIGQLPFDALDKAGLLDDRARSLRDKHRRTVGMVYDAIRRINREIGQLISDQIENLEDGQAAARVIGGEARAQAQAAARAASRAAAQAVAAAEAGQKAKKKRAPARKRATVRKPKAAE